MSQIYEDMLSSMRYDMGIQADVVTYGSVISSCERGEAARGFVPGIVNGIICGQTA